MSNAEHSEHKAIFSYACACLERLTFTSKANQEFISLVCRVCSGGAEGLPSLLIKNPLVY